jgi:hypothetical protein
MTAADVVDMTFTDSVLSDVCPAYRQSPDIVRTMATNTDSITEAADQWGFTQRQMVDAIMAKLAVEC